jgi:hypothetical protein
MSIPRRRFIIVALLLAGLHFWLAAGVSSRLSPAYDETAHLIAGASYWRAHDFRLQPENGLFPQLWAALPSVLNEKTLYPRLDQRAWITADVWTLGDQFLYRSGNDPGVILQRGRTMIALLGGALVFLIAMWSRSLFGSLGGLASGLLACFSPTLLAHAGLVTSDTAGALGYTAAILAWWRLCHRVSPGRIALATLAVTLLALSKYSVALFPLVALCLIGIRALHPAPLPVCGLGALRGWRRLPALLGAGFVSASLCLALVWGAYGFRYAARGPATPSMASFTVPWPHALIIPSVELSYTMADGRVPPEHTAIIKPGVIQSIVSLATRHKLLPEAWLFGLTFVDRYSRSRLAYFAGDWRITGWASFFPVAYLLKSTPAELILHLSALLLLLRGLGKSPARRRLLYRASPILVGVAVYALFAVTAKLNIGHRHILPIYALACVPIGVLMHPAFITTVTGLGVRRAGVALVLGVHLLAAWQVRPHYLTYFNFMAGGSDGGHRYFVDSSLDWGQTLPDLAAWLKENSGGKALHLSYFGNGDLAFYNIHGTRTGDTYFDNDPDRKALPDLGPGLYAISATMWQRVYTQVRGPWRASYEQSYQKSLRWLEYLGTRDPHAELKDEDGRPLAETELSAKLAELDQLRFGRLLAFLRNQTPRAMIAHTWFVFDLDEKTLNLALHGPPP